MKHVRKNRDRFQIAADILEIAKDGSGKTHIMYGANLSFKILRKYLDILTRSELLKVQERAERPYLTSEKGRRFIEEFHELQRNSEIVNATRRGLESRLKS